MKALIAMSGGVDSSVAAKLMLDAGYECIGCTMKLYQNSDTACDSRTCCSVRDVEDARSVAARLDIPYYVFNYTDEFRSHVMEKFARSYTQGLTPNPCIDCNKFLKFGALYERARELGCDCIVTGHYARIRKRRGKYELLRATDPKKDQSYVLYNLTQEQLAHTRFPLGEYEKNPHPGNRAGKRLFEFPQAGQPGHLFRTDRKLYGSGRTDSPLYAKTGSFSGSSGK